MTVRTSLSLGLSSSAAGTRYGTFRSTILRFPLTILLASVSSGTVNARAISSVVKPTTARRVRAIWASRASTGWQQVKMRFSRSSASRGASVVRAATRWSFSRNFASRRSLSSPLRLAVVSSQEEALSGTPSRGQCSSASTIASDTSSSARSRSPRRRTRLAVSRPASSRKTLSRSAYGSRSPATFDDWPHLDLAVGLRHRLHDGQSLIDVGNLQDAKASDGLLGLHQRPVEQRLPAALDHHGGGRVWGLELVASNHLAAGEHLSPPFRDFLHRLLALCVASVGEPLALGDQQHVLHSFAPLPLRWAAICLYRRMGGGQGGHT